jgi:precorrin-6A synthase
MLDGSRDHGLAHLDDDATVYWGAYVGTPDEVLVAGRVGDVREEILAARREHRERKGWIMDTYLVRRR